MSIAITTTQPAQVNPKFIEHTALYRFDPNSPDPELKKILPLLFVTTEPELERDEKNKIKSTSPVFSDTLQIKIKSSDVAQIVSPIHKEDVLGVSTYFSRFHPGIDYRAKIGTPVYAILPGVVNEVGFERGGYGYYVVLIHNIEGKTLFSLYAHLKSVNAAAGKFVEAGEHIADVGLTGRTTGPHLHFEVHDTNRAMDPLRFLSGNSLATLLK